MIASSALVVLLTVAATAILTGAFHLLGRLEDKVNPEAWRK